MAFHDVRFPTRVARGARGGPARRTAIVVLGSGYEERNSRWADSKRRYNAGYGVKSLDDLHNVVAFYEERRGQLHSFRWKDWMDYKSCAPGQALSALDQVIGEGDGATASFQLRKTYGSFYAPWERTITLPVAGTVLVAIGGIEVDSQNYAVNTTTGVITFLPEAVPGVSAEVTAGFEFDVPVRFDADRLEVDLSDFNAGAIPNIPLIEVRL